MVFLLIAIAVGYTSVIYMVDTGSALTTRRIGPWVVWTNAARANADPYTRAHFARTGSLPLSSKLVLTYQALTDETGNELRSGCDYNVKGSGPDALWWSLSLYDAKGQLIPNSASRHGFTSNSVLRRTNGEYTITIAREARAGNWLPSMRAGKLMLRLLVQQPKYIPNQNENDEEARELPSINQISCR